MTRLTFARLTFAGTAAPLLAAAGAVALMAAPAATAQDIDPEAVAAAETYPLEPATDRIRLVNINGYSVIDREHLVLNGGARRHYLVTLRHPCPELRTGIQIGTSFGDTATLYPPLVEYIHVGEPEMRCSIYTVEEIDSVETARALVQRRNAAEEAAADDDTPSQR